MLVPEPQPLIVVRPGKLINAPDPAYILTALAVVLPSAISTAFVPVAVIEIPCAQLRDWAMSTASATFKEPFNVSEHSQSKLFNVKPPETLMVAFVTPMKMLSDEVGNTPVFQLLALFQDVPSPPPVQKMVGCITLMRATELVTTPTAFETTTL